MRPRPDEAHAAAREHRPDVVLMDVNMPKLDGLSATRRLRENGFKPPVIALTASSDAQHRRRALAAGCDDYITKPLQMPELISALERHLRP